VAILIQLSPVLRQDKNLPLFVTSDRARFAAPRSSEENFVMKRLGPFATRRQLFRTIAAGAASVASLASVRDSQSATSTSACAASACNSHPACFLKGTRISTPSGYRSVQELQIGDEVNTLGGRKAIKWIGYNKFTRKKAGFGRIA
jgi:hypothetical protein